MINVGYNNLSSLYYINSDVSNSQLLLVTYISFFNLEHEVIARKRKRDRLFIKVFIAPQCRRSKSAEAAIFFKCNSLQQVRAKVLEGGLQINFILNRRHNEKCSSASLSPPFRSEIMRFSPPKCLCEHKTVFRFRKYYLNFQTTLLC